CAKKLTNIKNFFSLFRIGLNNDYFRLSLIVKNHLEMKKTFFQLVCIGMVSLSVFSCGSKDEEVVNIYTHRHYAADQELFSRFTELTGIKVNVVNASADELIQKLELEGANSPADILITVDAGRLHRAEEKGLFQ